MHVETVQHLFWDCMYAHNFWQKLVDFLKSKDKAFECNYKSKSLGVFSGSPSDKLQNCFIICVKYFIYMCTIKENGLIFEHFKHSLYQEYKERKKVTLNRDKLNEHQQKWQKLI